MNKEETTSVYLFRFLQVRSSKAASLGQNGADQNASYPNQGPYIRYGMSDLHNISRAADMMCLEPIFMMNQSYVYKSAKQGALNGATGDSGAALCNAYLYTEMVKIPGLSNERRPDDNTLVWSGNFCTLPKTVDGSDAIDGTFVFGRNVFLESFLLPELRALNKAFDIYHLKPYGIQKDDGRISSYEPYSIGYDENHRSINDPAFDFHNVNDKNDPDQLNGYYYEKTNEQPWAVTTNTGDKAGDLRASSLGQYNPYKKQ